MTTTTNITIHINKDLKDQAESLFDDLGMSISTAFNIFLKKCIREDRIPFEISRAENFNQTTIDAILEAERISRDPNTPKYHNLNEIIAALEANDDTDN